MRRFRPQEHKSIVKEFPMKCSLVIPVYNEKDTLAPLVALIVEHTPAPLEIIFVDDGSTDGSGSVLGEIAEANDFVRVISFPHNRGKSAALAEGFGAAVGDVIFMMDADLQDDPKEIPRFLAKLEEGYDVVSGWKAIRHDPWHKTFPSRVYNGMIRRLFNIPLHDINCGFKVFSADAVRSLLIYGDRHRVLPLLAASEGFRVTEIPVEHHPRRHGESKYGVGRLFTGAVDLIAVYFLLNYRRKPAQFFAKSGVISILVGAALALFVPGRISMLAAVGLFAGAAAGFAVGLMCELIVHVEAEKAQKR
jgi:dolichol-phosphate mannosyltransferase